MNGTARSGYRRSMARAKLTAAMITSIARWTPYLEGEMCGLQHLIRPGSVCIDVGSAAGLYTMALSRLAGPAGQVYSVEPLAFAHLFWARILNARQTHNVRHHAVALGAEPGIETMSVPVGRYGLVTGRSFLARQAGGPDSNAEFAGQIVVTVDVDTLDGLCAREAISHVDFIKIDVEGAELQVLEGGRKVIETHRPVMLIEIEARHAARYRCSPDDITGWLFQRGYTMHTWRHGWRQVSCVYPGTRNYLFRPSGPGADEPRQAANRPEPLGA
jgi:FkbM family methyltransferase